MHCSLHFNRTFGMVELDKDRKLMLLHKPTNKSIFFPRDIWEEIINHPNLKHMSNRFDLAMASLWDQYSKVKEYNKLYEISTDSNRSGWSSVDSECVV